MPRTLPRKYLYVKADDLKELEKKMSATVLKNYEIHSDLKVILMKKINVRNSKTTTYVEHLYIQTMKRIKDQ